MFVLVVHDLVIGHPICTHWLITLGVILGKVVPLFHHFLGIFQVGSLHLVITQLTPKTEEVSCVMGSQHLLPVTRQHLLVLAEANQESSPGVCGIIKEDGSLERK